MKKIYLTIMLFLAIASGASAQSQSAVDIQQLTQKAEAGDAQAQTDLGNRYYYGKEGVAKDFTEAVKWYRKAAEQGYARAQRNLGNSYYCGEGVTEDYAEAVKWYRKAAEQGYALALWDLCNSYYDGKGVEKDYAEAVKCIGKRQS